MTIDRLVSVRVRDANGIPAFLTVKVCPGYIRLIGKRVADGLDPAICGCNHGNTLFHGIEAKQCYVRTAMAVPGFKPTPIVRHSRARIDIWIVFDDAGDTEFAV